MQLGELVPCSAQGSLQFSSQLLHKNLYTSRNEQPIIQIHSASTQRHLQLSPRQYLNLLLILSHHYYYHIPAERMNNLYSVTSCTTTEISNHTIKQEGLQQLRLC